MSEFCCLFDDESYTSSLWKDVSLSTPLFQHELPMESGYAGSDYSSMSPTETISGSLWGQESPTDNGRIDDAILYSSLQTPDPEVLGKDFFDEMTSLDSYLHSNSSNSGYGFEDFEIPEYSKILSKPYSPDIIDSGLKLDFTQESVMFSPKEESRKPSPTSDIVKPDSYIASDTTNTDEKTVFPNDSYLSKLRNAHLKRNESSDSDEFCADALVVRLLPRSVNTTSSSIVPKQSRLVTKGVVKPSHTTDPVLPKKAAKVQNTTRNASMKALVDVRSGTSRSDDDDDDSQNDPTYKHSSRVERLSKKKRACNIAHDENKNAIQARINREKKKAYIADLEQKVADLESENKTLKKETVSARSNTGALVEEVAYLKAVLANQSALAQLLKNINGDATMPVRMSSSSEVNLPNIGSNRKRRQTEDHDYGQSSIGKKYARGSATTREVGVCLHVNKEHISLEMCRHCAQNSDARMS